MPADPLPTVRGGTARSAAQRRTVRRELVRWGALAMAVVVLVVFLIAQRQSTRVSYGQAPDTPGIPEGSAGELTDAVLPSVDELNARTAAAPVVRLDGSIASWDGDRVEAAIGDVDIRILVAPPGLSREQTDQLYQVRPAVPEGAPRPDLIRIIGTRVAGGMFTVVPDDPAGWRAQFAVGDVTSMLVTLVAVLRNQDLPPDVDVIGSRPPSEVELAPVLSGLRDGDLYVAPGADLAQVPPAAATAFPAGDQLIGAFPLFPPGSVIPDSGPALANAFPGRPVVVMYGWWIEYHGPFADEVSDVVAASFYGQFGDRISGYAYPQENVLNAYLGRLTDVRFAGLFEGPLPYQPWDPLRLALPALPWIFGACLLLFLGLSVRGLLRPARHRPVVTSLTSLTELNLLAIELSGLTRADSDAALVRGIAALQAARAAIDDGLPDAQVRRLLATAEAELDDAAWDIGRPDYQVDEYLARRFG